MHLRAGRNDPLLRLPLAGTYPGSYMSASLDTLEPLVEAVRTGVTRSGWTLSGLQKTTSYEFEGRWEGDTTRSAYLFFHRPDLDEVSVDVYLDETSRGLRGNLALVVDLRSPPDLPPVAAVLEEAGAIAGEYLPEGYRTPVTLRLRLPDRHRAAVDASVETRFKLDLPRTAIDAGASAVSALSAAAVKAFDDLLSDERLRRWRRP